MTGPYSVKISVQRSLTLPVIDCKAALGSSSGRYTEPVVLRTRPATWRRCAHPHASAPFPCCSPSQTPPPQSGVVSSARAPAPPPPPRPPGPWRPHPRHPRPPPHTRRSWGAWAASERWSASSSSTSPLPSPTIAPPWPSWTRCFSLRPVSTVQRGHNSSYAAVVESVVIL